MHNTIFTLFVLTLVSCSSDSQKVSPPPIAPHRSLVCVSAPDAPLDVGSQSDLDELMLVDLQTSMTYRLTDDRCSDRSPCLSPEGTLIVFESGRPAEGPIAANGPTRLFLYDLSTKDIQPIYESIITHLSGTWQTPQMYAPAWRPKSNTVAFVMDNFDSCRIALYDIISDSLFVGPSIFTSFTLSWSYDARYLAFDGQKVFGFGTSSPYKKTQIGFFDIETHNLFIIDSTDTRLSLIGWAPKSLKVLMFRVDSLRGPKCLIEYVVPTHTFLNLDTIQASHIIGFGTNDENILFQRETRDSTYLFNFDLQTKELRRIGPSLRHINNAKYFL